MSIDVYDSFARAPLDEPGFDHDDRIPVRQRTRGNFVESRALFSVSEAPPADYGIVVPYPGAWHEGDRGDAVYGIKRIVHRMTGTLAVLYAAPNDQKRFWGEFFTLKVERAQRRAGLPVTGVWDPPTHKRFAPWADQFALELLQHHALTPAEKQRRVVLAFLMAFYNRRWAISYSQIRPTELKRVTRIRRSDCSGSVAEAMWTAKVLPNVDWRWTNTDVQILFGTPVFSHLEVGDVPFYGHGSDPSHETCVVDPETRRVFSFGSYPARLLDMDYRDDRIAIRRFI